MLAIVFSSMNSIVIHSFATSFTNINEEEVFLKQQTSVTCTLSSAAMLLRRTAIIAGYSDWRSITEANIRSVGWVDGLGLLWNFSYRNLKIGHGYFSGTSTKEDMLDMLEKYPQGIVIYNGGNKGQSHAVFLTDYDAKTDTFYAADPSSVAPKGRVPLTKTTIVGKNQDEQIKNLTSYWFVSSPTVELENGVYFVSGSGGNAAGSSGAQSVYDSKKDIDAYEASMASVNSYFVVVDDSEKVALRKYPSGNSSIEKYVAKGDILYVETAGNNNFGALWYKTREGYYIYSANIAAFSDYSSEIKKFHNTVVSVNATYAVNSFSDSKTPLRIEPSEGNNILAYADNGAYLYMIESGVNSAGATWLRTEQGYYVKKSEVKLVATGKLPNSDFTQPLFDLSGKYSSSPIRDSNPSDVYIPTDYRITASFLNMRKSPVDGDVIVSIPAGTEVVVTDMLSGWGRIEYEGNLGWISLDYAEKIAEEKKPLAIQTVDIDSTAIENGKSVKCTVFVADDIPCSYLFKVCDSSGKIVFESKTYSASPSFEYKTAAPGTYYFTVEIKDDENRTASGYSPDFAVHNKLQLSSVKCSADDISAIFEPIVWTVNTVSSSDGALYSYTLFCDGTVVAHDRIPDSKFAFTPEKEGKYVLTVRLTDDFSESEAVSSDVVTVYKPLTIDAITLSSTALLEGSSVSCFVAASGGFGGYSYCFSLFKNTTLIKNGSFTTANTEKFLMNESGKYTVFCAVTDMQGFIVSTFSAEILVMDFILGDIDCDGRITAADARQTLRHSAGVEKLDDMVLSVADVNKDGKVNAADARAILRCAANIEKF